MGGTNRPTSVFNTASLSRRKSIDRYPNELLLMDDALKLAIPPKIKIDHRLILNA